MRVMFIRPPYTDYDSLEPLRVGIPLGTLSVAACIEQRGHEVKIFDSLIYNDSTADPMHFGASWERIEHEIKAYNPDVIGITNLFSSQIEKVFQLPKLIKKINPDIKIIIGGPHATVKPEDFLNTGFFDFVILGEGEITGADIIDYFDGKKNLDEMTGIAYMQNESIKIHPLQYIQNMDDIPYPAYHLIDMEKYFELIKNGYGSRPQDPFQRPKKEITMITSRGCPYTCTFCSIHPTMGYKYRPQSPEYVVNHIQLLIEKYGVELIHFEDDNLTLNGPRFHKILDLILERNLVFEWDTPNGTRVDTLKRDMLEKMKKAHVSELRIAIESADQEILDKVIKKSLDLGCVEQVAKDCHELGIRLGAFFVIGMPGETKEKIQKTLNFAYYLMKNYNVIPHVNVANPLVGTELYNTAKEKGYLISEDYSQGNIFGTGRISTPEFTPEDLKVLSKDFYKRIRTVYIINQLKNPKKILQNIGNFIQYPRSTIRLAKIAARYT